MSKSPRIRILAFDPAAGEMGWAVIDVDTTTLTKTVFRYGTLRGSQLIRDHKELLQLFPKNFIIMDIIRVCVGSMIREYRPNYVVYESAFVHKFPQAYASLVLVIHSIRQACKTELGRDAASIAPMETKKAIANDHMATKDLIRQKIMRSPTIVIKPTKQNNIADANEHEIDAIAHGCAWTDLRLPTLLMSGAIPEPPERLRSTDVTESSALISVIDAVGVDKK